MSCLLSIFVICQFTPLPRYYQTSVLDGSKFYVLGGIYRNNFAYTNEVIYIDLSKKFEISSPPWNVAVGTPDKEFLATSCLTSVNGSNIFLIGGLATDLTGLNVIYPSSLVYTFNPNTLQWTTTTTTGFYNTSKTMTRMQAVIVDNGNIFIFGGFQVDSIVASNRNGNYANFMNVLNANTLTWSQPNTISNALTPRGGYTANLLNNSFIIYIGGLQFVNGVYSNVDMNEIQIFNTNSLSWSTMHAYGDVVTARNSHTTVLTNDGHIILFGGNSANDINDNSIISALPDLAILDTNVSPYKWSAPNITSAYASPSLCYHSATLYNGIMFIAFGLQTFSRSPNYYIYIFDVQKYAWVSSSQPNALSSTTLSTISSTTSPTTSSTTSPATSSTTSSTNSSMGQGTSGIIISAIVVGGFIFIFIIGGIFYLMKSRNSRDKPIPTPGTFPDNIHVIPTPGTNAYRFHNDYAQNLRDSK